MAWGKRAGAPVQLNKHAGQKRSFLLLMVVPALVSILIFIIYPGFAYLPAAFKNWIPPKPLADAKWVGFKWFRSILNYYGLPELIRNSVVLGLWDIALLPVPMILALACQHCSSHRIRKALDIFVLIPVFIPSAVVVAVTQKFLSTEGLLNQFLGLFGVAAENHLLKGSWFYAYFSLSGLWAAIGFPYLVYKTCLASARKELHDAARLDGADLLTRILRIDLPLCRSTFLVNLTFQLVNILNTNTERLMLFKNNANSAYATTLDLYAYELTFKASLMPAYSKAIALSLMTAVINLILLAIARSMAVKKENIYV